MEAYCVKCKEKREIQNPVVGFNARSTPVTTGTCKECGTKLYRMGRTELHEGMVAPPIVKKEIKRSGKMVIVESPAKARTVGNFLGKGYVVRASVGHVRDLLRSQLSVDVENNFEPKYRVPNEKRLIVKELKAEAKKAEEIYLATDPDREGEAIAWHLLEAAELDEDRVKRVVFHEITKPAIEEAFSSPRKIDTDLVDAQQARRILDRLVGYNLTPLLWEKVRGRLSAGRVQSVTLRLIVEREREIEAFIPQEYWSIDANFQPEDTKEFFTAKLSKVDGKDPELSSKNVVDKLLAQLKIGSYSISEIKKGTRTRKPYAPFITSSMQQQASRQLGFTAKRTMRIAQQLYEGIDTGNGGETGLITYMRTDSINISPVAIKEVRNYIKDVHGVDYLPEKAVEHKTRNIKAQEAHEAIRPTSVLNFPKKVQPFLKSEQFKLYQLIWRRFVASQMCPAIYTTLSIVVDGELDENKFQFRASGSELFFPGFLVLYEEAKDEDSDENQNGSLKLPKGLTKGKIVKLTKLFPSQHFTQPPPRFTEASLIQVLEEFGIGRPSTYAPIISTIQARGYVERDNKRLLATETGFVVNDLLIEYFPDVLGVNFTAKMEEDLDEIADGKRNWSDLIAEFYKNFEPRLKHAQEEMPETKTEPEKIGRNCPTCGNDLIIKWGRFGKFISCSNYPECKYTEPFLEKIGVLCPKDGGEIVLRKTRKGRIFYGCENYPNCDFTSWKKPIKAGCPSCGGLLVYKNKTEYQCLGCENITFTDNIVIEEAA
ncbi:MAG: type I DNA topoisomerase [Pelolinea sp.]|nr:type I DNA topoisomerase [Pelolinea sp.]